MTQGALFASGDLPEARNGHSLSYDALSGTCFLFGGANQEGHLADLHRLSCNRLISGQGGRGGHDEAVKAKAAAAKEPAWDSPACSGEAPAAREMHSAAVMPSRRLLLVHGTKRLLNPHP